MTINTILSLPPPIKTHFSTYLLDPFYDLWRRFEDEIKPRANQKIRPQDVGKRKEFEKLTKDFIEIYECKKDEKAQYDEKVKNATKRSSLPFTGSVARFKRFQPQE